MSLFWLENHFNVLYTLYSYFTILSSAQKTLKQLYSYIMSPYKNPSLLASFRSALRGVRHGLSGRNLRIQFILGVIVLALAYYLPLTTTERYTIIFLTAFVISAELLNTAIEELADVLIQEHHPGVARVKELAAAGVLVISIASAIIGTAIFWRYF